MRELGIAVNDWKLPIFEKHLRKAGFEYKVEREKDGPLAGSLVINVTTKNAGPLAELMQNANDECRIAAKNEGHGHVLPRKDGYKAECGGPGVCGSCTSEADRLLRAG